MADTASCRNSECPENGVAKDTSMIPPDYLPLICGTCGQECERDDTPPG
jgi:hypothetical protein